MAYTFDTDPNIEFAPIRYDAAYIRCLISADEGWMPYDDVAEALTALAAARAEAAAKGEWLDGMRKAVIAAHPEWSVNENEVPASICQQQRIRSIDWVVAGLRARSEEEHCRRLCAAWSREAADGQDLAAQILASGVYPPDAIAVARQARELAERLRIGAARGYGRDDSGIVHAVLRAADVAAQTAAKHSRRRA